MVTHITAAARSIPPKNAEEPRLFDPHFIFLSRHFASKLIAIPYRSMRRLY
jgi:hypothetical protein